MRMILKCNFIGKILHVAVIAYVLCFQVQVRRVQYSMIIVFYVHARFSLSDFIAWGVSSISKIMMENLIIKPNCYVIL